jgi:threonine dehydratase
MEQARDLDAVFIAVGAGGLIGGTGWAIKAINPMVRIVGVWPEASPCMLRALEAGAIVRVKEHQTLSDATTGAIEPGSITFPLCQKVIDHRITVSEPEIAAALREIASTERWIVEGAAGVALAGLIQCANDFRGRKVAVVLCGRNIGIDAFLVATAARGR